MSATSGSTDPVETVYDILSGTSVTASGYGVSYGYVYGGATAWSLGSQPEIYYRWEVTPQERRNNPDVALYLWSPTESTREQLGAEYDDIDQQQVVEVSVWGLVEDDVVATAGDVISILEEYGNDNAQRTTWNRVKPTSDNDLRAEKNARQTDHWVIDITIDLRALRSSGLVSN